MPTLVIDNVPVSLLDRIQRLAKAQQRTPAGTDPRTRPRDGRQTNQDHPQQSQTGVPNRRPVEPNPKNYRDPQGLKEYNQQRETLKLGMYHYYYYVQKNEKAPRSYLGHIFGTYPRGYPQNSWFYDHDRQQWVYLYPPQRRNIPPGPGERPPRLTEPDW